MEAQEEQICPVCRKNPVPEGMILCGKCKEDNPYNLLGGYSPTKSIHDELKKVGEYKDEITALQRKQRIYQVVILILCLSILTLTLAPLIGK